MSNGELGWSGAHLEGVWLKSEQKEEAAVLSEQRQQIPARQKTRALLRPRTGALSD